MRTGDLKRRAECSRPHQISCFSAPGILVIQSCRTDLIGAAPTVDSSLTGLILEIRMKSGEIDRRFKGFHL